MKIVLNELISIYPQLLASYIELARTAAVARNWTEIIETTQKINMIQV